MPRPTLYPIILRKNCIFPLHAALFSSFVSMPPTFGLPVATIVTLWTGWRWLFKGANSCPFLPVSTTILPRVSMGTQRIDHSSRRVAYLIEIFSTLHALVCQAHPRSPPRSPLPFLHFLSPVCFPFSRVHTNPGLRCQLSTRFGRNMCVLASAGSPTPHRYTTTTTTAAALLIDFERERMRRWTYSNNGG